jgi:acetyl esterase/lipase
MPELGESSTHGATEAAVEGPPPRIARRILAAARPVLTAIIIFALLSAGDRPSALAKAAGSGVPPGTLLQAQPMPGAPDGASAWRILYSSTGLSGEPIPVSGVVMVPAAPAPPGGRPVVAWAHPTTGVVSRCAPSLARVFFDSVQGLRDMLARGYVVTATDYPGLGTPETHPYLVGVSEGRAVLDSVRAARRVSGADAGVRYVVWGHSQGGHAALYAGLLAQQYAPELLLAGIAAAAPATDLGTLMTDDLGTGGGNNITAMTLWSWSRIYGASITSVVTPQALPVINHLAGLCIERWFDVLIRRAPTRALERSFLSTEGLNGIEPWRHLLAENSPGPLPSSIPVFVAQGTADALVRPAVTAAYVDSLCHHGSKVRFEIIQGVGHAFIARDAAQDAVAWIAARFGGDSSLDDCGRT